MVDFVEAAKNGNTRMVMDYIRSGYNVDNPSVDGTTALYWAACNDHLDICATLLQHKADPDKALDKTGSSALHAAADRGSLRCLFLLLRNKANVNAVNRSHGDTPLHVAAYRGHYEACLMLLEYGADTAKVNLKGKTPRREAHGQNHYRVHQLLLERDQCYNGGPPALSAHSDLLHRFRTKELDPKTSISCPLVHNSSSASLCSQDEPATGPSPPPRRDVTAQGVKAAPVPNGTGAAAHGNMAAPSHHTNDDGLRSMDQQLSGDSASLYQQYGACFVSGDADLSRPRAEENEEGSTDSDQWSTDVTGVTLSTRPGGCDRSEYSMVYRSVLPPGWERDPFRSSPTFMRKTSDIVGAASASSVKGRQDDALRSACVKNRQLEDYVELMQIEMTKRQDRIETLMAENEALRISRSHSQRLNTELMYAKSELEAAKATLGSLWKALEKAEKDYSDLLFRCRQMTENGSTSPEIKLPSLGDDHILTPRSAGGPPRRAPPKKSISAVDVVGLDISESPAPNPEPRWLSLLGQLVGEVYGDPGAIRGGPRPGSSSTVGLNLHPETFVHILCSESEGRRGDDVTVWTGIFGRAVPRAFTVSVTGGMDSLAQLLCDPHRVSHIALPPHPNVQGPVFQFLPTVNPQSISSNERVNTVSGAVVAETFCCSLWALWSRRPWSGSETQERYVLHVAYQLVDAVVHLFHRGIRLKDAHALSPNAVCLNNDLRPVIGSAGVVVTETYRPGNDSRQRKHKPTTDATATPEVNNMEEDSAYNSCVVVYMLRLILALIVRDRCHPSGGLQLSEPSTDSSDGPQQLPDSLEQPRLMDLVKRVSSKKLTSLLRLLLACEKKLLSMKQVRTSLGVLLFGPTRTQARDKLDCSLWLQRERAALAQVAPHVRDDTATLGGRTQLYSRTLVSSVRVNDIELKRHFLSALPPGELHEALHHIRLMSLSPP